MPDYSFSPQFATIRSESPLAGMRPVEGLRHTALGFQPQKFLDIKSAQPELMANALASGLKEGVGGALQGITAAYVEARKTKAEEKEKIAQRAHEVAVANIKAKKSVEDDDVDTKYKEAQIKNIESLIKERGDETKNKSIKPAGSIPIVDDSELPLEALEVPTKKSESAEGIDFSLAPEGTENVTGKPSLSSLQAPQKRFSIPAPNLFDDEITFETYTPPNSTLDIAASAPPLTSEPKVAVSSVEPESPLVSTKPPSFSPQELASMAENRLNAIEKAKTTGDQMALEQQQVQIPQMTISNVPKEDLMGNFASYEEALAANKELKKRMPDFEPQDIEQDIDSQGNSYYTVKPPKQKQVITDVTIPEGLKIKSAKRDDKGNIVYDFEPTPEARLQIKQLKEPIKDLDVMLRTIQQIRSIYGGISPGVGGAANWLSFIPGSDAADVEKLTQTLQGNIAFKKLSEMKAASPTGGALGAISERELSLLSSSQGSIDPSLSFFLFKQNLDELESGIKRSKETIENEMSFIENPQKFTQIQSSVKSEQPIKINSQEDWNKLKKGQKFDFNGRIGTK